MTKPDKCKNIQCTECGNRKYCKEFEEYETSLDEALNRFDKFKVKELVGKWTGII
jgi:hypothetical protein